MKFRDIPQMTREASYRVNVDWRYLEDHLKNWADRANGSFGGLELDPPWQRAHVWDEARQIKYVEFILRGGNSSRDILFNNPTWNSNYSKPTVLVDGKQRLEAARKFMRGELKAFGHFYGDFTDKMPYTCGFIFHVNNLKTNAEVLQWYLDINEGGVAHTKEELDKVKQMLVEEV